MTYLRSVLFGLVVLAGAAGCATGSADLGQASPREGFWNETPECHGYGIYNRAADMCVNGGGF